MALQRWITEMGMGVDVHGYDYTKAARRAVSDALRHSSLHFFSVTDRTVHDMHVEVRIAVTHPDQVDTAAVAEEVPYGTVTITVQNGGLDVPSATREGDGIAIANAAILVSLDDGESGPGGPEA